MGSFNWQDEDENWEISQNILEAGVDQQVNGNLFQNVWLTRMIGLIAVGIVGIALFLWWWVDSVEQDLSADVLESWQIVVASDAADDIELFTNQLSGSNLDWIDSQKFMLEHDLLTSRAAILPSLVLAKTETALGEPAIEFSPDLIEAVLSHSVTYQDRWGRDIVLFQDEIFRLGSDRWLFSPPKASYWGEDEQGIVTRYSNRFAYSSPQRDIELTEKIILWFEDRLDLICLNDFNYACREFDTPQIEIRFLPMITPNMLDGKFDQQLLSDLVFELPTPSLIGMPANDASEQLLIEAYGEIFFGDYLLSVIGAEYDIYGDRCLRAVVEYSAQQVGALSPVTVDDYAQYHAFISKFNQDGSVIALNEEAQLEFSRLALKLIVPYRLQDTSITPQMLVEERWPRGPQSFCAGLFFQGQNDWDNFNRFVEVRAAIQN